jgi:anaerobic ribonucleoside-triphosphate reductase
VNKEITELLKKRNKQQLHKEIDKIINDISIMKKEPEFFDDEEKREKYFRITECLQNIIDSIPEEELRNHPFSSIIKILQQGLAFCS